MSDNPRHAKNEAKRIRYLGSAKSGTSGVMHMRLTSLALVPLTIAFVWLVLSMVGRGYDEVHATMAHPLASITLLLVVGTSLYHMQLGMRTIIEDYLHGERLKEWSLAANLFFAIALGVACVYAVLRLSFI
ncbi:succinate dehydrogenase, hydrophobic membrane anchor protein [Lichenihabitans sp. Uapishka_5]|uniref:succinate dehydrogenase, hydrophobic membrane anchor protein n=1 Tax=Lichenihabitans sp. Uapishka_5 TaxID=3037302 RepID=UPI0029E7F438|nr:succinate dehydrogenase, hydrophobic membrane anchor protein [Lichenihabitans sp. Uapishka_5]MDX7953196.1 succinate dehydrogenase, hydrophobic membrane anchor protein [Lichenihabitans sp. Uapishka_5]